MSFRLYGKTLKILDRVLQDSPWDVISAKWLYDTEMGIGFQRLRKGIFSKRIAWLIREDYEEIYADLTDEELASALYGQLVEITGEIRRAT